MNNFILLFINHVLDKEVSDVYVLGINPTQISTIIFHFKGAHIILHERFFNFIPLIFHINIQTNTRLDVIAGSKDLRAG